MLRICKRNYCLLIVTIEKKLLFFTFEKIHVTFAFNFGNPKTATGLIIINNELHCVSLNFWKFT